MSRAVGWLLDEAQRADLLARFPPRYAHVIAHHVTVWGRKAAAPVPSPASIQLVGHADDGQGLECYAARVDGETRRPDGNIYHVTWSLDPATGARPKDSNDLLLDEGWTDLPEPVQLITRPGTI